ncbi:MAG: RNA methyltransferase [Candidatus Omnitrophota bacterium]
MVKNKVKKYMLLYGKKSIRERLRQNPGSIQKIFLQDNSNFEDLEKIIKLKKIPYEYISVRQIEQMKRAKNIQGIIARVNDFKYTEYDLLLDKALKNRTTLVFLDRINDPQNLGLIIRSLACFGNFSIILPEKEACSVTEAVMHVAQGGENHVLVSKASDLLAAIKIAGQKGYFIIGGVVDFKAKEISKAKLKFPLALVLGAETTGISSEIQKILNLQVFIPMQGAKLSLNVSMAATVFAYEIITQRDLI